jgi:hypothetical protein
MDGVTTAYPAYAKSYRILKDCIHSLTTRPNFFGSLPGTTSAGFYFYIAQKMPVRRHLNILLTKIAHRRGVQLLPELFWLVI